MRHLRVIAPAELVKALREYCKTLGMSAYQDGKYLHLKWGRCKPLLDRAAAELSSGSFQIYRSKSYSRGGGYWNRTPDAIRIRTK